MSRLKTFNKKYSIILILLLFSLVAMSNIKVIASEPDPSTISPIIMVKDLTVNADGTTTINGLVSDNFTKSEDIVMKLIYLDDNQEQIEKETIIPNSNGTWSITSTFAENLNKYFIVAEDKPVIETDISNKSTVPVPLPPKIIVNNISKKADGETTIKGIVSDNIISAENINLKLAYVDENKQLIELETIIPNTDGSWSITKTLSEHLNRYYLIAEDNSGNETEDSNKTIITVQRPFITSIKLTVLKFKHKIIENGIRKEDRDETIDVDLMTRDDMTRVVLNPTITLEFSDVVPEDYSKQIYLYDKNGMVDSVIPTKNNNHLNLTFNNLKPRTTYYLMFNPSLISEEYKDKSALFLDDGGNTFFPMIKKFTTVSETVKDTAIDENTSDIANQPHGFYSNNVNTCANCHSTHVAENLSLDKPKSDYKEKAKENSYCMACHDGTLVAPLPENLDTNKDKIMSKHNSIENPEHSSSAGSCISCHNPHLTWEEDNPNLLKDHYVYTKNDGSKIDSLDQDCQSCHEENSVSETPDYHEKSVRKVLSYKKFTTTDGQVDNFSLCLRCHNGEKASNIKQYYEDENGVIESGHSIIAINGGKLRGNFPCSECHETHASTNLKLLKSKLGHENQDVSNFEFITGSWGENNERMFCMKCHNGKTSLYGVKALDPLQSPGHSKMDKCSDCHGGENNSFMEVAHAPKIDLNKNHIQALDPVNDSIKSQQNDESNNLLTNTNTATEQVTPTEQASTTDSIIETD